MAEEITTAIEVDAIGWLQAKTQSVVDEELQSVSLTVRDPKPEVADPDRLLMTAKRVVVENYNKHRDNKRSCPLTMEGVYIVWFTKVLGNWKAIVASPIIRGLLWEVSFSGQRNEVYIDVYKKLNNVKISLKERNA
jgi:Family of unknown function (DUF6275)